MKPRRIENIEEEKAAEREAGRLAMIAMAHDPASPSYRHARVCLAKYREAKAIAAEATAAAAAFGRELKLWLDTAEEQELIDPETGYGVRLQTSHELVVVI